ncbi:hypothetical protein G9274_000330 [Stenotrophomonas rhizophila]|nr:hypothetical protein G9274_000330 [Stenotrophomonas rhizophila]
MTALLVRIVRCSLNFQFFRSKRRLAGLRRT